MGIFKSNNKFDDVLWWMSALNLMQAGELSVDDIPMREKIAMFVRVGEILGISKSLPVNSLLLDDEDHAIAFLMTADAEVLEDLINPLSTIDSSEEDDEEGSYNPRSKDSFFFTKTDEDN
jgi:hypothetical protein